MSKRARRYAPPYYEGYSGSVATPEDFAKCGHERRHAIMQSLVVLMDRYACRLNRAEERLADASRAVEIERAEIESDRIFLSGIAETYMAFSGVVAAEATRAVEAAAAPLILSPKRNP